MASAPDPPVRAGDDRRARGLARRPEGAGAGGCHDVQPPASILTFPSFPVPWAPERRIARLTATSPRLPPLVRRTARPLSQRDRSAVAFRKEKSHAPFTSRAARVGRRGRRDVGRPCASSPAISERCTAARTVSAPTSPSCSRRATSRSARRVAAADLRIVRRPSTTVAGRRAARPRPRAVGRVVAVALLRDDVVGARHLVPARTGVDGVVADGRRAVHVLVKDGFQPPIGSVVDVLATYDPSIAAVDGIAADRRPSSPRGARVLALAGADRRRRDRRDRPTRPARASPCSSPRPRPGRSRTRRPIGEVTLALAPARARACCARAGLAILPP